MHTERMRCPNSDGWTLSLRRTTHDEGQDKAPGRGPVMIVPGYGMNSFIFGFHPRGDSLEAHLARAGFEVWSVDLRAQGDSFAEGKHRLFGLEDLALIDLARAVEFVRANSRTPGAKVDIIGCSLGATLMLMYAAFGDRDAVGSMVSMGGPLRWEHVHLAVRIAFASPTLAGLVPFRGTRAIAKAVVPWMVKMPSLLGIYLNSVSTDTSRAAEMIATVEDPVPRINRELATWINARDLTVNGRNLTHAVQTLTNPVMTVVALQDGVVPPDTARSVHQLSGASRKVLLELGSKEKPIAHADLFVCTGAQEMIFAPIAAFLAEGQRT